ncbi:uncharacterized protein METZ01_LOCUS153930 [marine metagenome]|uniref:Cell division protein ZapA n=1 Tax=marine metagenome TaxID=408172 RepID=A0A382AHV1_9ZZZZ
MGINYTLSCPPEKKENLIKAAKLVHDTMTSVDEAGIVFGLDRVAVMAAINIANDVITGNSETAKFIRTEHDIELDLIKIKNRLEDVNVRVETSLNSEQDLKLQ